MSREKRKRAKSVSSKFQILNTPPKQRSVLTPFTPRIELTPVENKINTYRISVATTARRALFEDNENLTNYETFGDTNLSHDDMNSEYCGSQEEAIYIPLTEVAYKEHELKNTDEMGQIFQNWSRESTPEPYADSGSEYIPSDDNEDVLLNFPSGSSSISDLEKNEAKIKDSANKLDDNLLEETREEIVKKKNIGNSVSGKHITCHKTENDDCDMFELEQISLSESETDLEEEEEEKQRFKKKLKIVEQNKRQVIVSPCLGKRYEKKQCCLYCKKCVIKLARHLITCHTDKADVQTIMSLKPNDKKRRKLIDKIRNMGNFNHNSKVLNGNEPNKYNQLIVKRRPVKENSTSKEFLPCEHCFGLYNRKLLFLHMKKCKNVVDPKKWSRVQSKCAMLMSTPTGGSKILQEKVLNIMKVDEVTEVVKSDELILLYGSKLCLKHGHEKHLFGFISTKMRELARLVLALRQTSSKIVQLEDIFSAKNFQILIDAVQSLTGFNPDTGKFKIPSLAKKLGHCIKYCSNILIAEYVKNGNNKLLKKVQDFVKVFDTEWCINISRNALNTLYESKWNKSDMLPLSEDIYKLNKYLSSEIKVHNMKLLECFNYESWNKLSKLMLARIILFNRRRAGETQRLTIKDLNLRSKLSEDSEASAKQFSHVEIKGKRGRKVPILLSNEDVEKLELLIKLRSQAGVHDKNPYVFGRLEDSTLRGPDVLNYVATECGAKKPDYLTSTRLRKHIATSCQILNLDENQMDYIAKYMGHDIKVHRNFYRLPDNALHLAKISKLLIALDDGKLAEHKGKNLDEISLEDTNKNDTLSEKSLNMIDINEDAILGDNNSNKYVPIAGKEKLSKPKIRKYWSEVEKNAIKKHLNHYIVSNTVPGMVACLDCKNSEPALNSRTWSHIKSWVHNEIVKKKKIAPTYACNM